jgi:ribosome-interacting GTPase 1
MRSYSSSLPETDCNVGRGRGRQVVSTAKTADLILIMVRGRLVLASKTERNLA